MTEIIKLARRILIFRENKIVAEIDDINTDPGPSYEYVSAKIGEHFV